VNHAAAVDVVQRQQQLREQNASLAFGKAHSVALQLRAQVACVRQLHDDHDLVAAHAGVFDV